MIDTRAVGAAHVWRRNTPGVDTRGVEKTPFDSRMGVQAYSVALCSLGLQACAADCPRRKHGIRVVCRYVGAVAHHFGTPVIDVMVLR
jgi:hypothetical protein